MGASDGAVVGSEEVGDMLGVAVGCEVVGDTVGEHVTPQQVRAHTNRAEDFVKGSESQQSATVQIVERSSEHVGEDVGETVGVVVGVSDGNNVGVTDGDSEGDIDGVKVGN